MGLHKLTAGDGYEYLTRQVAAADSTERGAASLADYYSEKGESPGRWGGSGLRDLGSVAAGQQVSEAQMKALFGEGLHPNADLMFELAIAQGASQKDAARAAKLGRAFKIDSGATAYRVACAEAFVEFNLAQGERWNAAIDPADRAGIRTRVGQEMFAAEYRRPPADERELSGWVAAIGRQKTTAVAGFDLTFTPVKSVSALWAVAPREVSQHIEAAHDAAIAAAITYLEEHACFTRVGTGGVAQVDGNGLIAAAFTHRDSRAGDPNLHTHVAISNKVATTGPDGEIKWLALDGAALYRNNVPASEVYNTVLEAQLRERIGVRFTERGGGDPTKRPVREIDGMDDRLAERWSSRSTAIKTRTAQLARTFQLDHGREPTAIEAISLAQQATLETRAAKHEPRSHADQRSGWRADAAELLGSERAVSRLVASVAGHPARAATTRFDERWVAATADRVVHTVSHSRSRFFRHNLRAEAVRLVRAFDPPTDRIDALVSAVTDAACGEERAVDLTGAADADPAADIAPAPLRRRDGCDVHTRHESQMMTTTDVLDAEARLVAYAQRTDGALVAPEHVEMALLESAANGRELNAGQRSLVRAMATSGAKVQLALAPAGTGKTTAMTALTRSWQNGGGDVVGFAPTAAAAAVLRQDISTTTETLAKFVDITRRIRSGEVAFVPAWFDAIGPDTLVIVDEAGMTGTLDLDEAVTALAERGATVRLIGDDQQLASVASGGVLRDIHDRIGALTLSQVVRFRDPVTGAAEGAASLALRDGDDAAIAFYIDHGRLHVGSIDTVTDGAYTAWAADRAAGRDALLLAPTRELVAELNTRARGDRLAAEAEKVGLEVTLADGLSASAGDIVRTRKNDRRNTLSRTDWVRNGDRWVIERVERDGSLRVRHLELGRTVVLDADYVGADTELGYAGTVHSAQGSTADTCHVVATGEETRQLAYVGLTRGRQSNHMYLATTSDGDLHTAMTERGMLPPTAVDDFRAIVRRDGAQVSAHSTLAAAADPYAALAPATRAYDHSVATGCEILLGPQAMAAIVAGAEDAVPGVSDAPAWPVLRGHLAIIAVQGRDAVAELTTAAAARELGTADDHAAVLDWRLDCTGAHRRGRGALAWLPAVPDALAELPEWNAYLTARADTIDRRCEQIAADIATWTPTTAPLWARAFVTGEDIDTALLTDLAVFRAAHDVDAADRRPTGPDQFAAASKKTQRSLDRRAAAVIGTVNDAVARWQPFADDVDRHIARDPYFPVLADRLAAAARAGIDVHTMIRTSVAASPLPDELPAAALWWRLSGELSSAVLDADTSAGAVLAPTWTPTLTELLGDRAAARVMADPAWPSLVATVDAADPSVWTPGELLGTAYECLHGGIDPVEHGVTLPPHELATALAMRAQMLVRENHLARTYVGSDVEPMPIDDEEALGADDVVGSTVGDELPPEFAIYDDTPTRSSEAPDEHVPSIPLGSDADYFASLDTLAAPDDYDAPPPPDPGAGDDVVEDAPTRTTVLSLPYPTVTTDERVRLLRRDLDAVVAQHRALRAAIDAGTSPALTAVSPMLIEMQNRADRQKPARVEMLDAREDWTDAALNAETLWHRIDTALRPAVAEASDDARESAQRELDWEIWRAGFADEAAQSARTRAHDAAAQYAQVTAADGGEIITTDVTEARLTAEGIDLTELDTLTAERTRLEGQLWRAEAAVRRGAMSDPAPHTRDAESVGTTALDRGSVTEQPTRTTTDIGAAEPPALDDRPTGPDLDADLRETMRRNPIRLVSDADLAAIVDRAAPRTEPTVVADTEKLYARLDEQSAAITAARDLDTELRRVAALYDTARNEHTVLSERAMSAKRKERPALTTAAEDARLRAERLERQVRETRRAADAAHGRVGAEPPSWEQIVARATDPQRRADDLAAARVFDSAITEQGRRLRAVTGNADRLAAERRVRAADAAQLDPPAISDITDADPRPATDSGSDAAQQRRVAHLLDAATSAGRGIATTWSERTVLHPDLDPPDYQRDAGHDHGL